MLTLTEAATELGCSSRSVRRLVAAGQLAAYAPLGGRALRIKRADLDELVEASRVPTAGSW
jgi:excisionase family DNA binding protein